MNENVLCDIVHFIDFIKKNVCSIRHKVPYPQRRISIYIITIIAHRTQYLNISTFQRQAKHNCFVQRNEIIIINKYFIENDNNISHYAYHFDYL